MDPRLNIIDKRLAGIKRIIAVSGGKGGIGKSLAASVLALTMSRLGFRVGLLDLDLSAPSMHVILGIEGLYPKEEKGIVPPEIYGIEFMSIVYFTGDNPSPLRGIDISNAMLELLAVTRWGPLDFLILDTPPGIGDATMDVIRWLKRAEFLIMTTASKVALETVKKVIKMLTELNVPIIGVIENMKMVKSPLVKEELKGFYVPILGEISFDDKIEDSIGDVNKLLETDFAVKLKEIVLNSSILKLQLK
ncbi:MAG: P-loop NTPase [Methanophagales archaeon]|nr:P-loop NTPase [Methanophagales archaeon]MCW3141154.1 P-loop NTPase [Methanophagales archaeon]